MLVPATGVAATKEIFCVILLKDEKILCLL